MPVDAGDVLTTVDRVDRFRHDLGRRVLVAWRSANFSKEVFPTIAADALRSETASRVCDYESIVNWAVLCEALPYQQYFDSDFGQPPLTLFWHSRFYIEALFWTTATPAIHNHAFSGAFTVLQGSSLQTTYNFVEQNAISELLKIGRLEVQRVDLLREGAVELILPKERLIHSVFHLDSPSVTLVVRTHSDDDRSDRFEYLLPGVAIDNTVPDQERARRLQCLHLLRRIGAARYKTLAVDVLRRADLITAFMLMRSVWNSGPRDRELEDVLAEAARERWTAPLINTIIAAFEGVRRRGSVTTLRGRVLSPELRLFIGLLLALPSRASILGAVQRMCDTRDAARTIADWTGQLVRLGSLDLDYDDVAHRVLTLTVADGLSLEQIVDKMNLEAHVSTTDVATRLTKLRGTGLLKPLFIL